MGLLQCLIILRHLSETQISRTRKSRLSVSYFSIVQSFKKCELGMIMTLTSSVRNHKATSKSASCWIDTYIIQCIYNDKKFSAYTLNEECYQVGDDFQTRCETDISAEWMIQQTRHKTKPQ